MDSNCVGNSIIVPGHQNYENTSDKLIQRSESNINLKDSSSCHFIIRFVHLIQPR